MQIQGSPCCSGSQSGAFLCNNKRSETYSLLPSTPYLPEKRNTYCGVTARTGSTQAVGKKPRSVLSSMHHAGCEWQQSPEIQTSAHESRIWTHALATQPRSLYQQNPFCRKQLFLAREIRWEISTRDNRVKDRWQIGEGFILSNIN